MCRGINITDVAQKSITRDGKVPLSLFEYPTTAGISLVLPGNVYVNAQFSGKFRDSDIVLDYKNQNYWLRYNNEETAVDIISLPDYFDRKDENGTPYSRFIITHADRMRINPIRGCSFACKYCDLNKEEYSKTSFEKFKEAIEVALADKNITPKHLLISGGVPREEDKEYLDDIYQRVTRYFLDKGMSTDVMLPPRKEEGYPSKLKSWGVNSLSINLEIYNRDLARKFNPQKAALTRELYFDFIGEVVEVFGRGKVRSILIAGLEPVEETIKGAEELAKLGSDIVLSPFVPGERTELAHLDPPAEEDLIEVYRRSKEVADTHGVKIGPRCIPCQHNTLAFPDGSADYFFS